jgi:hypothetical protein
MLPVYQCAFCRHFRGSEVVDDPAMPKGWRVLDQCPAFPDGIPPEVLDGRHNHRLPHPGDGGTRFEAADDEAERMHRASFAPVGPPVPGGGWPKSDA